MGDPVKGPAIPIIVLSVVERIISDLLLLDHATLLEQQRECIERPISLLKQYEEHRDEFQGAIIFQMALRGLTVEFIDKGDIPFIRILGSSGD